MSPKISFFRSYNSFSLSELIQHFRCEVIGDVHKIINGVATLQNAGPSDLTFLANYKYRSYLSNSRAGVCILRREDISDAPEGMTLLIHQNPLLLYAKVVSKLYSDISSTEPRSFISERANIDKNANIGADCYIEAGVFVGEGASIGNRCKILGNTYIGAAVFIGENTYIGPNSTLMFCNIGKNVVLHSGVCIGQDGFGFAMGEDEIVKVKQIGSVIIEDAVEIGANTCIDRGAIEDTIIGRNTKIDNLVQIAHNVIIGENCFIVAQSGVSGSVIMEEGVMLGGQAGLAGHLVIGKGAHIAAQSLVMQNVESGATLGGSPAVPISKWHRQTVFLRNATATRQNES